MKRVLFVDDESSILSGLKRMLHPFRAEWEMSFANSGAEALALIEKQPFDIVVSDMRMPAMDGIQFLTEVRQRLPHAVRVILSGHADRDSVLRSVGCVHQFLSKPCDPKELKATVQRALALRELLLSERLAQVVSRINSLPNLPQLYLEIQDKLRGASGSIEDIGRLVAKDVGMSAKVLQLVNSAFFGVPQRFTSAVEATVYLGLDTIVALVLTSQVFGQVSSLSARTIEGLWNHSLATGAYARAIAQLENLDAKTANQAFLAGMLHEVGLLVLSSETPDELAHAWRQAQKLSIPTHEAERRFLGASHAAVGAYLLGIWGLGDPVVESIAFHHTPSSCPHERFSLLTAVHVGTCLDSGPGGSALGESEHELDLDYLERLGLGPRLPVWREHCRVMLTGKQAA
jgi:HD-like signal output (HDOD) protein